MLRELAIKALRFSLRALEAPKGERLAIAKRDVTRKVAGAHRYVAGVTQERYTAEAIRFRALLGHYPRSHRAGNPDRYRTRYALGYASI